MWTDFVRLPKKLKLGCVITALKKFRREKKSKGLPLVFGEPVEVAEKRCAIKE